MLTTKRFVIGSLLVVVASLIGVVTFGGPAESRTTSARLTPGTLIVPGNGTINIEIYNPTGVAIHVNGHLADPSAYPWVDTSDWSLTVAPGTFERNGWACTLNGPACAGVPIITVSSRRAVVNGQYEQDTSGDIGEISPGDFRRL